MQVKSGRIKIEDTFMDYITFGRGKRDLLLIPGIGDGLKTVKGMALPFSLFYRQYAKDFRVYVFSRKQKLEKGCTTRMMARDLARAMNALGIKRADVIGISQGGMIAQFLAIDYPKLVKRLVLVSTIAKAGPRIKHRVPRWISMVERKRFDNLMTDIVEKMYSPGYVKRNGWLCPIIGRMLSGVDKERFCTMARACSTHNALPELKKIRARTLVIGAGKDRVVGIRGTKELAEKLPNCHFILYKNGEHGVYDEAPDFHRRVIDFLKK